MVYQDDIAALISLRETDNKKKHVGVYFPPRTLLCYCIIPHVNSFGHDARFLIEMFQLVYQAPVKFQQTVLKYLATHFTALEILNFIYTSVYM